jgi:hypothetical protein
MAKLTLNVLIKCLEVHDDKAMPRTEADRLAYVAKVDQILFDAGWTADEYELALAHIITSSYVVAGVRYCKDCGNCDCPNASTDPYWAECPAAGRILASKGVHT